MTKAVVIGAGFGGLALAIRLQAAGFETVLLEKRDKPGGRAYVYEEQGFVFDAGPTVITDPTALEELFAVAGRRLSDYVELLPVSPFYRLSWESGFSFDYVNDQEALDRRCRRLSPFPRLFRGGIRGRLPEARSGAVPLIPRHGAGRAGAGQA
jgi:phytoene desaturase